MATIDTAVRRPPPKAQGAMTGERYVQSLRDGREIWFDGERVARHHAPGLQTHDRGIGARL